MSLPNHLFAVPARLNSAIIRDMSGRRPNRPVRLTDVAFERMKRDIVSSTLQPGAEVTEAELARRYKLGKAPVRAALLRLCQEEWVRAVPRKGYLIAPVTVRDVQAIFQLRQLLEPTAVRLAAGHVDGEQLKKLDKLCQSKTISQNGHSSPNLDANRVFHVTVARACGNERLAGILEKLHDQLERLFNLGISSWSRGGDLPFQHAALIEALVAGDGEAAARISAAEIESGRKMVMNAILSESRIDRSAVCRRDAVGEHHPRRVCLGGGAGHLHH